MQSIEIESSTGCRVTDLKFSRFAPDACNSGSYLFFKGCSLHTLLKSVVIKIYESYDTTESGYEK